jgi:hypothetical protein
MSEGVAIRLPAEDRWSHLGGAPEAKPIEVILRSFDRPVLFATGAGKNAPDAEPVTVAAGEGARLTGMNFFAKPAPPPAPCRVLVRGF